MKATGHTHSSLKPTHLIVHTYYYQYPAAGQLTKSILGRHSVLGHCKQYCHQLTSRERGDCTEVIASLTRSHTSSSGKQTNLVNCTSTSHSVSCTPDVEETPLPRSENCEIRMGGSFRQYAVRDVLGFSVHAAEETVATYPGVLNCVFDRLFQ